MTSVSPDEAGLDEGHVPVDLGAVPEGFDVGSVDGQSVDQSADPDSVTGCRKTKTLSGCLSVCSLSLSLPVCLQLSLPLGQGPSQGLQRWTPLSCTSNDPALQVRTHDPPVTT